MTELLSKIGLLEKFTFEVKFDKSIFIDKIKSTIHYSDEGYLADRLNSPISFTANKSVLKGRLNEDGFIIKRRRGKIYNNLLTLPFATGVFYKEGDVLKITTEIRGLRFGTWFIF